MSNNSRRTDVDRAPVFGELYADIYDTLYQEKDYQAECDEIQAIFHRYSNNRVKSILDLGCGTGNHAIPLAQRGYKVTGIDISPSMLSIASSKVEAVSEASSCLRPVFMQGDIRNLDLHKTFDAVIMMFAVLGYQTTNEDILSALRTVARHLDKGGLFVFDAWYGPAVLTIRPGDRVLHIADGKTHTIRTATTTLDALHQLARVHYTVLKVHAGAVHEAKEDHSMRFFFPQELDLFLSRAGLNMIALFPSGAPHRPPTDADWNVTCVAKLRDTKKGS